MSIRNPYMIDAIDRFDRAALELAHRRATGRDVGAAEAIYRQRKAALIDAVAALEGERDQIAADMSFRLREAELQTRRGAFVCASGPHCPHRAVPGLRSADRVLFQRRWQSDRRPL